VLYETADSVDDIVRLLCADEAYSVDDTARLTLSVEEATLVDDAASLLSIDDATSVDDTTGLLSVDEAAKLERSALVLGTTSDGLAAGDDHVTLTSDELDGATLELGITSDQLATSDELAAADDEYRVALDVSSVDEATELLSAEITIPVEDAVVLMSVEEAASVDDTDTTDDAARVLEALFVDRTADVKLSCVGATIVEEAGRSIDEEAEPHRGKPLGPEMATIEMSSRSKTSSPRVEPMFLTTLTVTVWLAPETVTEPPN
jgi:hypothetical protein